MLNAIKVIVNDLNRFASFSNFFLNSNPRFENAKQDCKNYENLGDILFHLIK